MESKSFDLADIFDISFLNNISAIRVISDINIIGLQFVDDPNYDLVSLPALVTVSKEWSFPISTKDVEELCTTIALWNPTDFSVDFTAEAFDSNNKSLGIIEKQIVLPRTSQFVSTKNINITGYSPLNDAVIKVITVSPVISYKVHWYCNNNEYVTVVIGTPELYSDLEGSELKISQLLLHSTATVKTTDLPTVNFVRMPIGDDAGKNMQLLSIGYFNTFSYPKIRFNDNGDGYVNSNEWFVATAHNNNRWLNNGWNKEPSDNDASLYSDFNKDGVADYHPGEDWNLNSGGNTDLGKPVYPIAEGIVLFNDCAYGKTIIIVHKTTSGEFITSFYGHLNSVEPNLSVGAKVDTDKPIGFVGKTVGKYCADSSTMRAHLHFEIRKQSMVNINSATNEMTLAYPAAMWPATNKSQNGDNGKGFIQDNYYNPSAFLKQYNSVATTGGVYGWLLENSLTGKALPGATVTVAGKSTTTNTNGYYYIGEITHGTHDLKFAKTGFQSYSKTVAITAGISLNAGVNYLIKKPNLPASLNQYKSDGTTSIAYGGTTNQNTVVLKGVISDSYSKNVKLQVELRRLDEHNGGFTGTSTQQSAFLSSGSTASIKVTGLINGNYHWSARTVNSEGASSKWVSAGGNLDLAADFIVNVSNIPPIAEAAVSTSATSGPYHWYDNPLTVTKGKSVTLYFFADKDVNGDGKASLDPNGWTNAENGVSSGGKCEWNTDLNQGAPTFEKVISNPAVAGSCYIGHYTYTFNDAAGTYEYQVLRITDRKDAQSNVSRIRIKVVDPLSTPTLLIDGSTSSTKSQGGTFTFTGSNYTPNGTVARYLKTPGSTTWQQLANVTASSSGNVSWSYTSGCSDAVGTYYLYARDVSKGQDSNQVTETITASSTCASAEVIVDDKSSGFTKYGTASYWKEASIGYNGHMFYTYNSTSTIDNYAIWKPNLPSAGTYTVSVYIPNNYATTTNATYSIYHNGTTSTKSVNQNIHYNVWVSLGSFYFSGNGSEYVKLVDKTGEANVTKMIGFDAVKWVKQ